MYLRISNHHSIKQMPRRNRCKICHQVGHNRRTCPQKNATAPQWLLQNQPSTAVSAVQEEEEDSCPICMEPIGKTNCATTACGHKFCLECFLKHSQIKDQCPMCRTEVPGASKNDWKAKYEEMLHFARQQERYEQRILSELVEKRNVVLQLQMVKEHLENQISTLQRRTLGEE